MKPFNVRIPNTEKYRALREVFEAAKDSPLALKVDDTGSITFVAGDKTAFVHADDPMNDVFRRGYWDITQH